MEIQKLNIQRKSRNKMETFSKINRWKRKKSKQRRKKKMRGKEIQVILFYSVLFCSVLLCSVLFFYMSNGNSRKAFLHNVGDSSEQFTRRIRIGCGV